MTDGEQLNMGEHLEELRKRLIVLIISIAAFGLATFFFSDALIAMITLPIKKSVPYLYFDSPYEAFMVR